MKQAISILSKTFFFVFAICHQVSAETPKKCADNEDNCWSCGDECVARLSGDTLNIVGNGTMTNYAIKKSYPGWIYDTTAPWDSQRNDIKTINISEGIKSVGEWSFYGCDRLQNVNLPKTLSSVGKLAFHDTGDSVNGLSVSIPSTASLSQIGAQAFQSSAIRSMTIPDGITSIPDDAFWGTRQLSEITIPDGVTSIGKTAFEGTYKLDKIVIPDSVTSIAKNAFNNSGATIYCTQKQIDNAGCNPDNLGNYRDPVTGIKTSRTADDIIRYEKSGNHYNIFDANGKIVAQYASMSDFGTQNNWKPKRIYTIKEATEALGKTDKNTFSIIYR